MYINGKYPHDAVKYFNAKDLKGSDPTEEKHGEHMSDLMILHHPTDHFTKNGSKECAKMRKDRAEK